VVSRRRPRPRHEAPSAGARVVYHVSLVALSLGAAGIAGLGVYAALRGSLEPAFAELWQGQLHFSLAETLALVVLTAVPALAGPLAYFVGWQTIRLMHLAGYLRALHRYLRRYLRRHAPLARLGFTICGVPFGSDGLPQDGAEQPLAAFFPRVQRALVLGDHGAGKTTALYQYALQLTRRRHLLSIAFGLAPLPVLVPLAAYAAAPTESEGPRLQYLAAQVRAFGHRRLAARLLVGLHRWNVALLCDGLEEVPNALRAQVAHELGQLGSTAFPHARVAVTCTLNAYLEEPEIRARVSSLHRAVVIGLNAPSLEHVLHRALRTPRVRGETFEHLSTTLQDHHLGAQVSHPATLAAALEVRAAGLALPQGRARVLAAYANLLCTRATDVASDRELMRESLGYFAHTLRWHGVAFIEVGPGESPDGALQRWFESAQPPPLGAMDPPSPANWTASELAHTVAAAIAVGILEWLPDGLGLRFAREDVAAAFAAFFLASLDDESTLPRTLLHRDWREPLLIWSVLTPRPGDLAGRILSLATRRASTPRGRVSGSPVRRDDLEVTALALAVALEGLVPTLSPRRLTTPPIPHSAEQEQSHLRDLIDRAQIVVADPDLRPRFGEAMVAIERDSGFDLSALLASVAHSASIGRLAQGQAIGLLGALNTPSALDALMALLIESDSILRSAVDAALASAGPVALSRLQEALSNPDEQVRSRATETLSYSGPAAMKAAISGLEASDPRQRAAAARVLGTLRARDARDALVARLDDPQQAVRVAAAWALGRVGTRDLISALEAHLATPDAELRATLAHSLGSIRHIQALPALTQLLDDPVPHVRAAAAEALGKLGDDRAISPLRTHLDDGDPWAQAAASTALRRLRSQ
jgi:HEAT repeat protein